MRRFSFSTLLWLIIVAYIIVFGIFTALRHYQFQTQTWDLGAFDQTFWNTVHGHIMQNSLEEIPNHLAIHMSPGLFLLVPGYAIFPSPYYLLVIQTLALGLGAWPLYLLAKKYLQGTLAFLVALSYLLYPSLQWINTFDFHEIALFVPLALAGIYSLDKAAWSRAFLFLALAASMKEDAILAVGAIGIFFFIKSYLTKQSSRDTSRRPERRGLWIAAGAVVYFFVAIKFIMPHFGGGLLRLDRYAYLGHTFPEILKTFFTRPRIVGNAVFTGAKLAYVIKLFFPVAFLPFFSGAAFILVIPGLLENLLTNFQFQFQGLYQYDAVIIPGLFASMVYALYSLRERNAFVKKYTGWIIMVPAIISFSLYSPISPFHFPLDLFKTNPTWEAYRTLVNTVPDNARVAVPTNLVPHLTNRTSIQMLGRENFPPDIVIIDTKNSFGFSSLDQFAQYIEQYTSNSAYGKKLFNERYIILVKKDFGSFQTIRP